MSFMSSTLLIIKGFPQGVIEIQKGPPYLEKGMGGFLERVFDFLWQNIFNPMRKGMRNVLFPSEKNQTSRRECSESYDNLGFS